MIHIYQFSFFKNFPGQSSPYLYSIHRFIHTVQKVASPLKIAKARGTPFKDDPIPTVKAETLSHSISSLQTFISFNNPPHTRHFFDHITDFHFPLPDFELQLLAPSKLDRHLGKLCRVPRELDDFDVDVRGAAEGRGPRVLEQAEEKAARSGKGGERRESGAERSDCLDGDGHCLLFVIINILSSLSSSLLCDKTCLIAMGGGPVASRSRKACI